MSLELQQKLEKEYLILKGNLTVEDLYERITPKYGTVLNFYSHRGLLKTCTLVMLEMKFKNAKLLYAT